MTWYEKFIIALGVIKSSSQNFFGKSFGKFFPGFWKIFSKKFHNSGGAFPESTPPKVPPNRLEKVFHFFPNFFQNGDCTGVHTVSGAKRVPCTNRLEKFGKNVFYERRSYGGNVAGACLLHMFEKTLRHRIPPLEPGERRDASTESSAGDVQCTRTKSPWPLGPSPSQRVHYAVPVASLVLRSCERYLTPGYSQDTHTTAPKTAKRMAPRTYSKGLARVLVVIYYILLCYLYHSQW